MRIISWNLEYAKSTTPEAVAADLAPWRPDVICFCEVPGGGWTDLAGEALGMAYSAVGRVASANHDLDYPDATGRFSGKFRSILSRAPLTHVHEVLLEGVGWQPASVLLARTVVDDAEVLVGALHIPTGASAPAASCAGDLARFLEYLRDERMIMAGDYNDLPASAPLDALAKMGFRCPWSEVGFAVKEAKTHDAKSDRNGGVIDHILFRGPFVCTRSAILDKTPPRSDHFAILADLK